MTSYNNDHRGYLSKKLLKQVVCKAHGYRIFVGMLRKTEKKSFLGNKIVCNKIHVHTASSLIFLILSLLLLLPLVLTQFLLSLCVCLFINSLSTTTEGCRCTVSVDLCVSRVAAGVASWLFDAACLLIINGAPQRELHEAYQPIKSCFIPCTALYLHKPP